MTENGSNTSPSRPAAPSAEKDTTPAKDTARADASSAEERPVQPGDHVWLVDGSGFIFRAYHALPPLTRKSDGLPVGAVHGFAAMLHKLLNRTNEGRRPTHLAVIFDAGRETFRNKIFPQYKANRPEPPEDLVPQFELIRRVTEAFNVPAVEQEGYEADDLIATYARLAREAGATVHIVSSDKDLMQLVHDGVTLYDAMKDREIGPEEVMKRFGVPPEKVPDVQALAGDSTDNIPGVPGIGVKTAAQLINEYGSLENLLEHAGEIRQPKRRQRLLEHAGDARLSKRLVTLDDHAPLPLPLSALAVRRPDPEKLIGFLKGLEFTTLTSRIARDLGVDPSRIPATEVRVDSWQPPEPEEAAAEEAAHRAHGPVEAAEKRVKVPFTHAGYELITSRERLEQWLEQARAQGFFAFDVETTSLDAMRAEIIGFALALAPDRAAYVPVGHRPAEGLNFAEDGIRQLPLAEVLSLLRPLLEDPCVLKIAQNVKYDDLVLSRHGIRIRPFDDTMLISYVLDAGRWSHGMDELSKRHLGHVPISFKDVAGRGRKARTFDLVPPREACEYAAEDADVTLRLWLLLKARLYEEHMCTVYETLERPLAPVLVDMERTGVLVDRDQLARISREFAEKAQELEARIHELAGTTFNVGSTRQLAEVLFGRLGLKSAKKTATGARSTDNEVLEELAAQGVEIARLVLEWRQLMKLRSTYAEALARHINPRTGRVHTSFSMAATNTGRLASTDPNLQNIPVRTPEGRRIRAAFIAPAGARLLSADYSQIELRVLAHVADVKRLQEAFREGLDIHAMTASDMFGVPVENMDPLIRRRAKAINFGIIYGISAHGLSRQLGIPREEAAEYIKTYFRRFPEIRDYMEATKAFAREHGYVETIFGRRIHFPNIDASNPTVRAFNERAAINAPIQGSAADIIRRAMIRMPGALREADLAAKMLLQVHDELVFEVPEEEVEATIRVVTGVMTCAPEPAVHMKVPLKVDARAAANWEEAH
jgi:DNA polymerase-1